jgi:hypothetical protein
LEYKKGRTDEHPDSYTYSVLIKSLTGTNRFGFEEKCVEILRRMEENEVVGMSRILYLYNEVMKAFARSTCEDAGDLAEGVFNQLVARYERTRNREMRPDRFSFMALLRPYARSCTGARRRPRASSSRWCVRTTFRKERNSTM